MARFIKVCKIIKTWPCSRGGKIMNALNQIILEGNVVRQPEKKENVSFSVCTFPLAVNRFIKTADGRTNEEVSYFDVDSFGNLADVTCKCAFKGRGVRVVGRLKQERWKDADGKGRSKVKIIAEHIEYKPVYKKTEDGSPDENAGPALTKKQKLALLQEAAMAAKNEQEVEQVEF